MSEGPRQTQTLNSIDRDPAYETPGKKAAQILEKSLEEYEDYALLGEAFARFFLVKGSHVGFDKKLLDDPFYKNSRLFRNYLLTVRPGGKLTTRDLEKFLPSKNAVAFDRQTQDAYQATKDVFQRNMIRGSTVDAMDPFFAVELALWTQNSRKIVSLNTKAFASFTDPKEPYESSWDEMIFPHETFMIEPPQGAHKVTLSGVEHQLVGLMVNHNEELHRVSIRPFFEPVDKIYRTRVNSNEFLEATEKFLKGKITPQSAYAFSKAQQEEERKNPDGMRRLRYHGNAFAFSTLGPIDDPQDDGITRTLKRVVAGTCMYMNSAPHDDSKSDEQQDEAPGGVRSHPLVRPEHRRKIKEKGGTKLGSVITERSEVLSLRNIVSFSPSRNRLSYVDSGTGNIVDARVVRSHKRRPPNKPEDHDKTVLVKSYWKATEQLPPNALPGGSVVKIAPGKKLLEE